MFCLYILCLEEHIFFFTDRLKLRFWSLCGCVENIDSGKKFCCGFKIKKSSVFHFSELFWREEMERKFHRQPTLSTKPAQNVSTVTLSPFITLKHVLCLPSHPSCDLFLSWLRRFEIRSKMLFKNRSIGLNFGKSQKNQKSNEKLILAGGFLPTFSFLVPRRLPASGGRAPQPQSGPKNPDWTCSSRKRSFPALRRPAATRTCSPEFPKN
jgi:hypothetical protein